MIERFLLFSTRRINFPLIYFTLSLLLLLTIYFYSENAPSMYRVFSVFPTENSQIEEYINNISTFFNFGPEKYLFFSLNYLLIALFGYTILRRFFDSFENELFLLKITASFGFGYICTIGILRPLTLFLPYNQIYYPTIGFIGIIILIILRKKRIPLRDVVKGEGKIFYLILPTFFFSVLLLQIYQGDYFFVGHGSSQYAFNLINWPSLLDHFPIIKQHYDELIFHYFLITPLTLNFDPILPIWLTLALAKLSTLAFLYLAFRKLKLSLWFSILASAFMMLGTVSIFPDKYYLLIDSSNPLFYSVHIARIIWLPIIIYFYFIFIEKNGSTYLSPLFYILAPIGISSIVLTTGIWILLLIVFWYFHKIKKNLTYTSRIQSNLILKNPSFKSTLSFRQICQYIYKNFSYFAVLTSIFSMVMLFSDFTMEEKNNFMILHVVIVGIVLLPKFQWNIYKRFREESFKKLNIPLLVFFIIFIFSLLFLGNFLLKTNIVSSFFDQFHEIFGKIEIKNFGREIMNNDFTLGKDCRELRSFAFYSYNTQFFIACYGIFIFISLFTFLTFKKNIHSGKVPVILYDTFLVCLLSYPILLFLANFGLCDQRAWVKTRFLEIPFYLIIFSFFFALNQLKFKYLKSYLFVVMGVIVYMVGPIWGSGRLEQIFNNGKIFLNSQHVNGNFLFNPIMANLNGLGKKEVILCDQETGNLEVVLAIKGFQSITKKLLTFPDSSLCVDFHAIDLNQDGKDDLIFKDGRVIKMIAISQSYQENFSLTLFPLDFEGNPLLFDDMNDDSFPDLVHFRNPTDDEILIEVRYGDLEKSTVWGTFKARVENLRFEDLNNDGKLDLLNQNHWIAFSNGNGFKPLVLLDTPHHRTQNIFFEDINNDDKKDILYLTEKGIQLWMIPSQGIEFGPSVPLVTIPNGIHVDFIKLLDLDSDGNKDIILYDFTTKGDGGWTEINKINLYTSFMSNGEYLSPKKLVNFAGVGTLSMFDYQKFDTDQALDIVFRNGQYRVFTTNSKISKNHANIFTVIKEWGSNDQMLYYNLHASESILMRKNLKNGKSSRDLYHSKLLTNIDHLYFKDINGDNQEDILYIDQSSTPGLSKFFVSLQNNGNYSAAKLRLNHLKQRDGLYELGVSNQKGQFDIHYNFYSAKKQPSVLDEYRKKLTILKTDNASEIRTSEEEFIWEKIKQVIPIIIEDSGYLLTDIIYPDKKNNIKEKKLRQRLFEYFTKIERSEKLKNFLYRDLDSDGKKDLIYIDTSSKITKVYVSIKEGDHYLPGTVWLRHGESSPEMFTFEDYNKDGKTDILYHDKLRSGKYYLSHSDPISGKFTEPQIVEAP